MGIPRKRKKKINPLSISRLSLWWKDNGWHSWKISISVSFCSRKHKERRVGWGLVYFFFIPLYFIAFVRYDFHRKLLAIKGWMSDTIAKDSRTSAGGNFESLDPQLNVELTEKGNRMWKKRGEHIKGDPTSTVAVRSYSVVMSNIQIFVLKPFDVWKPHFLSQGLPLTFTKTNVDRCFVYFMFADDSQSYEILELIFQSRVTC